MHSATERFAARRAVTYRDASGRWTGHDYRELGRRADALADGLAALGLAVGDTLSILASTRREWTYVDLAAISAGVIVAPIYQTGTAAECAHIINDSGARAIVVENAGQLEKIRAIRDSCPRLEHVVLVEGTAADAISLDEVERRGRSTPPGEIAARRAALTADDVFTLIYTSGTTGPPKGCLISHGNYLSMMGMIDATDILRDDDVLYLFLPLAHAMALLIQLVVLERGLALAYWSGDPDRIVEDIGEIRPTLLPAVPRIFEKIHATAQVTARTGSPLKRNVFYWAVRTGRRYRELLREGGTPGPLLRMRHRLADRLVLRRIRNLFGGRLRFAVSGAAPINPEILRFFDAAGVLVLEGWGLTEASPAATLSTPSAYRFGSIGRPLPGCEVKVADDGELLVRGGNVSRGYLNRPEETAAMFRDGWLQSGDLGEIDADGFITITGRKKDLIITAGGKNISPANIETELRRNPLVAEAVVIGDRRPYLVALVSVDREQAADFFTESGAPLADPVGDPRVRAEIGRWIEKVNAGLANAARVRRFALLDRDLTIASGALTPTLKVKRAQVAADHAGLVDDLYAGRAG